MPAVTVTLAASGLAAVPAAFQPADVDYGAIAPMLVVIGGAILGVLVEAFAPRAARHATQVVIALVALFAAFLVLVLVSTQSAHHGGTLRQVTLAPELPGGMDAIHALSAAGVAVAVGHTAADYDQALAAFDAGASILTHAFNAMPGLHHRAPGPVAAATRSPGVTLEIVNDGVHVHPEVVRMAFAAAPGRVALITDAMAAAGSADGDYRLGGLDVEVREGVARLAAGGSIAGSTLTLDDALRRAVLEVGIPVAEAVRAVTSTPAAAVGRGGDLGRLLPGYAADAVLLDADFTVRQVWSAGAPVL